VPPHLKVILSISYVLTANLTCVRQVGKQKPKAKASPLTSSIPTFSTELGFSGVSGSFFVSFSTTTSYIASIGTWQ
jgi:hypothetical protein